MQLHICICLMEGSSFPRAVCLLLRPRPSVAAGTSSLCAWGAATHSLALQLASLAIRAAQLMGVVKRADGPIRRRRKLEEEGEEEEDWHGRRRDRPYKGKPRPGPLSLTSFAGVGAWDSVSDTSTAHTPTPPPTPRSVKGVSRDFHENIVSFRRMCVDKTAPINPRPLRTNVGELTSPIVPGVKPAGGFSPPISPLSTPQEARLHPCLQKTLANHYPVSRLNPMPTVVELVHQHKQGEMSQDELWHSIHVTRELWAQEKKAAEERVYEQRARREALARAAGAGVSSLTSPGRTVAAGRRAGISPSPSSLPTDTKDQQALARVDVALVEADLRRDGGSGGLSAAGGRSHSSSDERADHVLARLRALTATPAAAAANAVAASSPRPTALRSSSRSGSGRSSARMPPPRSSSSSSVSGRRSSSSGRRSSSSGRRSSSAATAAAATASRAGGTRSARGLSPRAGSSSSAAAAASSSPSTSTRTPRSAAGHHKPVAAAKHDDLGEAALYQDARPGTEEEEAVEEAEVTLKRMMVSPLSAGGGGGGGGDRWDVPLADSVCACSLWRR
jgi:hypothetical protein